MHSFCGALYHRELGAQVGRPETYRKLYGDRRLIEQLDIVNELDGHSGCVNALSWSKSGRLLASGSDDQHLNIHEYQPASTTSQFKLTTTVATGHTANIFSVKFMPHSNDRTVITAAGDAEVRIFDLEYAGQRSTASTAASIASERRRGRRNNLYNDVIYLTDGDTDCRVYRSHADRVKRIVTESSPYLFLTCSEDGEVRQWDLRQPSSFYPRKRSAGWQSTADSSIPPPLISYRRYNLDLNTISCSASQPHYIALGGAHVEAFLHDRRMTGRDRLREAGRLLPSIAQMTEDEQELMTQATQCVRKFASSGRKKRGLGDNGHITACKISDARPNEMVVSWSGDYIYSFDLIHSNDADEDKILSSDKKKHTISADRKRKRKDGSEASPSRITSRRQATKTRAQVLDNGQDTALRVHYRNGQSEDIPILVTADSEARSGSPLTEKQRTARRVARSVSNIRSELFRSHSSDSGAAAAFSSALGIAASILPDLDDLIKDWRYPMEPSRDTVIVEQRFRENRDSVRRFVQASGTLARALGGRLQTPSGDSRLIANFTCIETRSSERLRSSSEQFGYDFLKAIILWLESGIGKLIEGFSRPASVSSQSATGRRLPIPEADAVVEAIDDLLIPYLLDLASDKPITNVEVNRFEVDANTQLFPSELAAVRAFAQAVKIPFADLSSAAVLAEGDHIQAQDRQVALRFWGKKVARGVLLNAAQGVKYNFANIAFGGRMISLEDTSEDDVPVDDDVSEENRQVAEEHGFGTLNARDRQGSDADRTSEQTSSDEGNDQEAMINQLNEESDVDDEDEEEEEIEEDHDEYLSGEDESLPETEENDSPSLLDEGDGVLMNDVARILFSSGYRRNQALKEKIEPNVPCSSPKQVYKGHCNVKTVKDVNYFGLDDEYVVSGSDDGNFFIWDRKTGELVNMLEGDGEVVNVIQGHPYEPTLAVSGIDHTIKIFSPDARAREAARLGAQGISSHDASEFSSLSWPRRHVLRRNLRRAAADEAAATSEPAVPAQTGDAGGDDEQESEDFVAVNGLRSRKRMNDMSSILRRNEAERNDGAYMRVSPSRLVQLLFDDLGHFGLERVLFE